MNQKYATNRSMVKIMLLSIVTFGIYDIITYYRIGRDLNKLVPSLPPMRSYIPVVFVPTMGIWRIVWMHKTCNKIGYALKERGINYSFSAREFWLFDILLSVIYSVGAWLFTWRLCKAMNLLCADENARMAGTIPNYNQNMAANNGAAYAGAAAAGAAYAGATYAGGTYTGATADANAAATGETTEAKPSAIGQAFKNFAQFFLNTFKKPLTAPAEFFENATIADSAVVLGIVGVAYVLIHFLEGIYVGVNRITSLAVFGGVGAFFGGFFLPIVYFAVMSATVFGLYALVNKLFIKKPLNIQKLMAFCAACGIGLLAATVVAFLGNALYDLNSIIFRASLGHVNLNRHNVLALALTIVGNVVGLYTLIVGLMNLKKVFADMKSYLLTLAIGVAGLYVANYIFNWLFVALPKYPAFFFTLPM